MKKKTIQTLKKGGRFCGVLCLAVMTVFALFAACERPEPEPEPPTPPDVNTDSLPANKFIGTWVLCGQSSADEEPPCVCSDNLNSVDTLVFTADNLLTIRHSFQVRTYTYDYTPSFLLFYESGQQLRPQRVVYGFRVDGNELKLTGNLPNIPGTDIRTTSCFAKTDTPAEGSSTAPEMPFSNRYLGTWVSCCWTSDPNEDPGYNCTDSWPGDTLVFTEDKMLQKGWGGIYENGYEFTNTCSYLIYFRENLGLHQPNYINKTQFLNDTVFCIYRWEYPAYNPTGGQYYNVSFKKIQ